MNISYKAAYHLIDRFYKRTSIDGYIKDCQDYFQQALDTAKELEDYDFLEVMINQRDSLNNEFVIFFNYKNILPTVLNKDEDLSLEAFGILCVDCNDIPDVEFIEIVEAQAKNHGLDSIQMKERFLSYIHRVRNMYRLVEEKINRNDRCPCESGLKYKNCHGKLKV